MRVIIREAAYDDLEKIHSRISEDRPRSADAVIKRILESAERLGQFPQMGHEGRATGTFEWAIPGLPYVIVYQIREKEGLVIVAAVFHGAQHRDDG
jgi:toxin ParE1/3/4